MVSDFFFGFNGEIIKNHFLSIKCPTAYITYQQLLPRASESENLTSSCSEFSPAIIISPPASTAKIPPWWPRSIRFASKGDHLRKIPEFSRVLGSIPIWMVINYQWLKTKDDICDICGIGIYHSRVLSVFISCGVLVPSTGLHNPVVCSRGEKSCFCYFFFYAFLFFTKFPHLPLWIFPRYGPIIRPPVVPVSRSPAYGSSSLTDVNTMTDYHNDDDNCSFQGSCSSTSCSCPEPTRPPYYVADTLHVSLKVFIVKCPLQSIFHLPNLQNFLTWWL